MNKEEFRSRFEENLKYLQKTVPPDDIYIFCEQTISAAMYFIIKWREHVDLTEEAKNCPISKKWLTNILSYEYCRREKIDISLDLDMESVYDN